MVKRTSRIPRPNQNGYRSVYNCHPSDLPLGFSTTTYPWQRQQSEEMKKSLGTESEKTKQQFSIEGTSRKPADKVLKLIPKLGHLSLRSHDRADKTTLTSSTRTHGSLRKTQKTAPHTSSKSKDKVCYWKPALDPKSGRTYYYNSLTRETQWRKPMELTTPEDRQRMAQKERKQLDFFAAMESNILNSLALGSVPGTTTPEVSPDKMGSEVTFKKRKPKPSNLVVRTISVMNENVLQELVHTEGFSPTTVIGISDLSPNIRAAKDETIDDEYQNIMQTWKQNGEISLTSDDPFTSGDKLVSSEIEQKNEAAALAKIKKVAETMSTDVPKTSSQNNEGSKLTRPVLGSRRNTCSTLYLGSTLSAPDVDATIKCICAVYRAHILQFMKEEDNRNYSTYFEEYDIFNDFKTISSQNGKDAFDSLSSLERGYSDDSLASQGLFDEVEVPSLEEITTFYRNIFLTSRMESDCIIISLIYVEKIMRATNNGVRPTVENWRSLFFSSMIMASKVWDDLSMWNADFSAVSGVTFSLQRINELEMAMLNCLNYDVKVLASEYAKYYFLLRSMLIQSGLSGKDHLATSPLDAEGAKKFEHVSANYKPKRIESGGNNRRAKSMGDVDPNSKINVGKKESTKFSKKAVLERLVPM